MSWIIRSAVHRANLTRIRSYADSVVQHAGQAVIGGAKLFHGRATGSGQFQSIQQTVKRLEEFAVSAKGDDRLEMLRSWLDSLTEVETFKKSLDDAKKRNDENDESTQPTLALYEDIDHGSEPWTFLDVFLRSQALEGITLSMILEAPNDEEVALIREIFRHCLLGGEEVHNTILGSILDLAKVFSCYHDELLMKRDELLQYAQSSISGLKVNATQARIDVEVTSLRSELMKDLKITWDENHDKPSEEIDAARTEAMKEALSQVRHYSKLKALLLQKKDAHHGDSVETHAHKVDKLKVLLQSLANSSSKSEKKIEDHRRRREEAFNFRMIKENEVSLVEKDLLAEIEKHQQRKDELEAQLKEVNTSLAVANGRLQIAREERQHFDKASTEILYHFESKEKELLRSIALCKTETDVASAWISFIESTWCLQCNFSKQKQELINAELRSYAEQFVNLSMHLLPAYKIELSFSVKNFQELAQKLHDMSNDHSLNLDHEALASAKHKKKVEEEFLELEAKLRSAFSVVESIKELLGQSKEFYRKDEPNIQEVIGDLEKVKDEFESIERPDFLVDTPTTIRWRQIAKKLAFKEGPIKHELPESRFNPHKQKEKEDSHDKDEHNEKQQKDPAIDGLNSEHMQNQQQQDEDTSNKNNGYNKYNQVTVIDGQELLDSDDELMTALESEFVKDVSNNASHELNDWEV